MPASPTRAASRPLIRLAWCCPCSVGQLGRAAGQGQPLWAGGRGRQRWSQRGGRRGDASLLDRLVDLGGLGQRGHAQLLAQHAHAFPVLALGVLRLAGPGVEQHQQAVGRLVQRIDSQQAQGLVDGFGQASLLGQAAHQLSQRAQQQPAQALGLHGLPLVEGDAVAQAEASQKNRPDRARRPRPGGPGSADRPRVRCGRGVDSRPARAESGPRRTTGQARRTTPRPPALRPAKARRCQRAG
jgi:hypothetical protein